MTGTEQEIEQLEKDIKKVVGRVFTTGFLTGCLSTSFLIWLLTLAL